MPPDPSSTGGGTGWSHPDRPRVLVFDVNETLSDMAPMADRFTDVGAPAHLAATWFAGLLRDGFALTVTGANPAFAELGEASLRGLLTGVVADVDAAVATVMGGFTSLPVHADVVEGTGDLHRLGLRLVTLSNGSASVAEGLLERTGIAGLFEMLLSVEDAPRWKPDPSAYAHALDRTGVEAREAMLVAVHPWDTHGAHEAGLRSAWVNRTGADYPPQFAPPDLEVASLVDLAAALGAAG